MVSPLRLDPAQRVLTLSSLIGMAAVTLFVGTEAFAALLAGAWSIAGLLHLGSAPSIVLFVIAGVIAIAATVWTARAAYEAETDPDNQH